MMRMRTIAALAVSIAIAGASACAPRRVQAPPPAPQPHVERTMIALLPDPGAATIGRAIVSTPGGSVELDSAREFTTVALRQAPSGTGVLSEADVKRLFGDAIDALPPAPVVFTLYFRFESDELTDEGRALLPEVLRASKNRPVPDVSVVGHTDTKGSAARNYQLGLKRAQTVRSLLLDAGVTPASLEVASHGEAVPLVPTRDETYEPRNRRVDVTIR